MESTIEGIAITSEGHIEIDFFPEAWRKVLTSILPKVEISCKVDNKLKRGELATIRITLTKSFSPQQTKGNHWVLLGYFSDKPIMILYFTEKKEGIYILNPNREIPPLPAQDARVN